VLEFRLDAEIPLEHARRWRFVPWQRQVASAEIAPEEGAERKPPVGEHAEGDEPALLVVVVALRLLVCLVDGRRRRRCPAQGARTVECQPYRRNEQNDGHGKTGPALRIASRGESGQRKQQI